MYEMWERVSKGSSSSGSVGDTMDLTITWTVTDGREGTE